ncbi:MAG: hypothetical protein U9Q12_02805, partial [Patescibacteria group bacterium]|nr:hypothetical protein [Patescibacteria group bacterium]
MFGLRGRDTFNKPTSDISDIMKKMRKWGAKAFPYVLGVLIIFIGSVIGYVWYTNMNTKNVSEEEKQQYIDKKSKETLFKKEKFDELKAIILLRQEHFDESRNEYSDIFYDIDTQQQKE